MVKYCFVDFNGVLCVHLDHSRDAATWFRMTYEQSPDVYDDIDFKPLPGLREYLTGLQKRGCDIQMLTHCFYSYTCDCKKAWVDRNYPGLISRVIGIYSTKAKLVFLKQFAHMVCCDRSEILLIDNDLSLLRAARAARFTAYSPAEVVTRFHESVHD